MSLNLESSGQTPGDTEKLNLNPIGGRIAAKLPAIHRADDGFYPDMVRAILPFCGNEYPTSDFHAAVRYLNHQLDLRLDPVEERVMSLMLTGLSQAFRFGGSLFIAPRHGENSAVHESHTAILLNEFYRRAGLLGENIEGRLDDLRREQTIACLLHDLGEILAEINTTEQRARNGALEEMPEIESIIFSWALRLAFEAVLHGEESQFYGKLHIARNEVKCAGGFTLGNVNRIIQNLGGGNSQHPGIDRLIKLYDLVEKPDWNCTKTEDLFFGALVKQVEHLQGSRQLIRFAIKETQPRSLFSLRSSPRETAPKDSRPEDALLIPLALADSHTFISMIKYAEAGVAQLCSVAQSKTEIALARNVRIGTYQTVLEMLECGPKAINLSAHSVNPYIAELADDVIDERIDYQRRIGATSALIKISRKIQDDLFSATTKSENGVVEDSNSQLIATAASRIKKYEQAIYSGYVPKLKKINGQQIGELLIFE